MRLTRIGIWAQSSGMAPELVVTNNAADLMGASGPEREALLAFTQEGIDADFYYNLIAMYPFTGSSLANKMYNLVDPEDSNEALRLTIVGTVTSHAKGLEITSGGVSNYLQTHLIPELISGGPYVGGSVYLQTAGNYFQYTGPGTRWHLLHYDGGTNAAFPRIGTTLSSQEPVSGGNNAGHWAQQRPDNTKCETWSNGVLRATNDGPEDQFDAADNQQIILALGTAGIMSYQAIFRSMSSTKMAAFNTAIQNLMTALNRNV